MNGRKTPQDLERRLDGVENVAHIALVSGWTAEEEQK